jgi:hypothetical protein
VDVEVQSWMDRNSDSRHGIINEGEPRLSKFWGSRILGPSSCSVLFF